MRFSFVKNTLLIVLPLTLGFCFSCGSGGAKKNVSNSEEIVIHDMMEVSEDARRKLEAGSGKQGELMTGADQPEVYRKWLYERSVGVVANQTSNLY